MIRSPKETDAQKVMAEPRRHRVQAVYIEALNYSRACSSIERSRSRRAARSACVAPTRRHGSRSTPASITHRRTALRETAKRAATWLSSRPGRATGSPARSSRNAATAASFMAGVTRRPVHVFATTMPLTSRRLPRRPPGRPLPLHLGSKATTSCPSPHGSAACPPSTRPHHARGTTPARHLFVNEKQTPPPGQAGSDRHRQAADRTAVDASSMAVRTAFGRPDPAGHRNQHDTARDPYLPNKGQATGCRPNGTFAAPQGHRREHFTGHAATTPIPATRENLNTADRRRVRCTVRCPFLPRLTACNRGSSPDFILRCAD